MVRHHHERWDGSGYPDGLEADTIPLGARIFALVDALDAMTSDRPYRPALTWRSGGRRDPGRDGKPIRSAGREGLPGEERRIHHTFEELSLATA